MGTDTDLLAVSQYVRNTEGIRGEVTDYSTTTDGGTIAYRGAGYSADLTFNATSGAYEINVVDSGWVAVIQDLHKGNNTGAAWSWVIDVSAILLITVSITGLTLALWLRTKERPRGLILGGLGAATVIVIAWLALT